MPKRSAFQNLSFAEQMARALPIARQMLIEGIDTAQREDVVMMDRIGDLIGDATLKQHNLPDDDYTQLWDRLEGALSLGIAVGLMLNGDVFLKAGGGR